MENPSNPNPWWRSYRENMYKPQHKESMEFVVRRSLTEAFSEYLLRCSISGVSHITDPSAKWWQKIFWCMIFALVTTTLVFCLMYIWSSISVPLVVSMESTTYPISEIDFPAVAICNVNRVNKKLVNLLADELYDLYKKEKSFQQQFKSLEYFRQMIALCGRLINFEFVEDETNSALEYKGNIAYYDTHTLVDLMKRLSPNCSEILERCYWAGDEVECGKIFATRRTAHGHCCAFNYVLKNNGIMRSMYTMGEVKRQRVAGQRNGLLVYLNPQIEDYAYPLHPLKGFDIMLFDGTQFPDMSGTRIINSFVEANTVNYLELQSRKLLATAEVRKYSPFTRNCYFHDEVPDFGSMYSMSACISKCRITTVQSLCKCTPFFLPISRDQGPVCTLNHLKCLNKYKEKLFYLYPHTTTSEGLEQEYQNSLFCPECLPDCENTKHNAKSIKINMARLEREDVQKFLRPRLQNASDGGNFTNKCILSVYQATPDGVLNRLDVTSYWFEIFSNFGGFAGLLLGLTLTTLFEIIYFFTFYAILRVNNNYHKYN